MATRRVIQSLSSLSYATRSLHSRQRVSLDIPSIRRAVSTTSRNPYAQLPASPASTSVPPASEQSPPTSASSPAPPEPVPVAPQILGVDWSSSFHGLSITPFAPEVAAILQAPIPYGDVEVKPDGIVYLPEIKYRRILNAAFGPGGWGLAPRGDVQVAERVVTREYALVVHGRFVAQARGENQFFSAEQLPAATEGCKSNALMRCCKDLGIASELWDPRYIREFKKKHCQNVWVVHAPTSKKKQIWIRKGDEVPYPFKPT